MELADDGTPKKTKKFKVRFSLVHYQTEYCFGNIIEQDNHTIQSTIKNYVQDI